MVEDGPTLTHGGMSTGAGVEAARLAGARPRSSIPARGRWGSIAEVYRAYPHLGPLLPAVGYFDEQLRDLEATIAATPVDVVVIATPFDITGVIRIDKPFVRVRYELEELDEPQPFDRGSATFSRQWWTRVRVARPGLGSVHLLTLIALGGNALIRQGEAGTSTKQRAHIEESVAPIARVAAAGMPLIITHGNGPIVGQLLLQGELAKAEVPLMPLHVMDAESQGSVGFLLQQALSNHLLIAGIDQGGGNGDHARGRGRGGPQLRLPVEAGGHVP